MPVRNGNWNSPLPLRSRNYIPGPPPRNFYRPASLLGTPPMGFQRYQQHGVSYNVPYKSHGDRLNSFPGKQIPNSHTHPGNNRSSAVAKRQTSTKENFELPPRFQKTATSVPLTVTIPQTTQERTTSPEQVQTPTQTASSPTFSPDVPEFVPRPELFRSLSVSSYTPPTSPVTTSPVTLEPGLPFPKPRSNKELIDNYAFTNGLKCVYRPCPTTTKKQKKTMWLSQLILDDQKFLSYPMEMSTPEEANEEAAKRAVEKLNIDPNNIGSLPIVPHQTPAEIQAVIEKITETLTKNQQGTVNFHVQDQFKKRHRMRLPPNWIHLVQNVEHIRIDKADETHFILFHEPSTKSAIHSPSPQVNGSSTLRSPSTDGSGSEGDSQYYLPEPLSLPDGTDWFICVTYASSTANVCFRFLEGCNAFENFDQEIQDHYTNLSHTVPVTYPVCGAPYCAKENDRWHRVIVQNIDETGEKVLCDFPDFGDSSWVDCTSICELDKKFLKMPFQAIRAELFGMTCFANDQVISEKLVSRISDKALVAQPRERDDETISLVLFDTSTDDDVNINQSLLDEIFAEITPPDLSRIGTLVDGFLGDILPSGDVRLQIVGRSSQLLSQLLENVEDLFQTQKTDHPVEQVSYSEVYGVLYCDKWHRAIPASEKVTHNQVSMLLTDIGIQTDIPLSDICHLTGETEVLSTFPSLAVRCHLSGLSEDQSLQWDSKAKEKLSRLVPKGTPLLVKVASKTTGTQLPIVDLFKRLEANKELVSINQTLVINFSSHQPELNGTVENHVERKLSRPTSFRTVTPPTSHPESPSVLLSPTDSYSFVENNEPFSKDQISGFPLVGVMSLNSGLQDLRLNSPTAFDSSNPLSVIQQSSALPNLLAQTINPKLTGCSPLLSINNNVPTHNPMLMCHNSVTPPIIPNIEELLINQQEEVPEVGEYFDVFITSAANPNTFFCQSRKSLDATASLFEEMQQFYNSEENTCEMHQCLVQVGKFFALKHKDGFWYRVRVQKILMQEPFTVLIFLLDYGGFEMVELSEMQALYGRFCNLPYQAISASLSGIQPVSGDYSSNCCLEFKEMVEEKNFVSIICSKEVKDVCGLKGSHVKVTLVDTSTPDDVYVHLELIRRGISKAEEGQRRS